MERDRHSRKEGIHVVRTTNYSGLPMFTLPSLAPVRRRGREGVTGGAAAVSIISSAGVQPVPPPPPPTSSSTPQSLGSDNTPGTPTTAEDVVPVPHPPAAAIVAKPPPPKQPRDPHSSRFLRDKITILSAVDRKESFEKRRKDLEQYESSARRLLQLEESEQFDHKFDQKVQSKLVSQVLIPAAIQSLLKREFDSRAQVQREESQEQVGLEISFITLSLSLAHSVREVQLETGRRKTIVRDIAVVSNAKLEAALSLIQSTGRRYLGWRRGLVHSVLIPQDVGRRQLIKEEDSIYQQRIQSEVLLLLVQEEEKKGREQFEREGLVVFYNRTLRYSETLTLIELYHERRGRRAVKNHEAVSRLALLSAEHLSRRVFVPEKVYRIHTLQKLADWVDESRLEDVKLLQQYWRDILAGNVGRTATQRAIRKFTQEHRRELREAPSQTSSTLYEQIDAVEFAMNRDRHVPSYFQHQSFVLQAAESMGRSANEKRELDFRTLYRQQWAWQTHHQLARLMIDCEEEEEIQRKIIKRVEAPTRMALRLQLVQGRVFERILLSETLQWRNLLMLSQGRVELVKIVMWIQRKWRYILAKRAADEERIQEMRRKLNEEMSQRLARTSSGRSQQLSAGGGDLSMTLSPDPRSLEYTVNAIDLDTTYRQGDQGEGSPVGEGRRNRSRRNKYTLSPSSTAFGLQPLTPAPQSLLLDSEPSFLSGTLSDTMSLPTALSLDNLGVQNLNTTLKSPEVFSMVISFPLDEDATATAVPGATLDAAKPTEGSESGSDFGDEALGNGSIHYDEEGRPIVTDLNQARFLREFGEEYFAELLLEVEEVEADQRDSFQSQVDRFYHFSTIYMHTMFPCFSEDARSPGGHDVDAFSATARRRRSTKASHFTTFLQQRRRFKANVLLIEEGEVLNRRDIEFEADTLHERLSTDIMTQPMYATLLLMTSTGGVVRAEDVDRQVIRREEEAEWKEEVLFPHQVEVGILTRAEARRKQLMSRQHHSSPSAAAEEEEPMPLRRRESIFLPPAAAAAKRNSTTGDDSMNTNTSGGNDQQREGKEVEGKEEEEQEDGGVVEEHEDEELSPNDDDETQPQSPASSNASSSGGIVVVADDEKKEKENGNNNDDEVVVAVGFKSYNFTSVASIARVIQRWFRGIQTGRAKLGDAAIQIFRRRLASSAIRAQADPYISTLHESIQDLELDLRETRAVEQERVQQSFDDGLVVFRQDNVELLDGAKEPEVLEYYVTDLLLKLEDTEEAQRYLLEYRYEHILRTVVVNVGYRMIVLAPLFKKALRRTEYEADEAHVSLLRDEDKERRLLIYQCIEDTKRKFFDLDFSDDEESSSDRSDSSESAPTTSSPSPSSPPPSGLSLSEKTIGNLRPEESPEMQAVLRMPVVSLWHMHLTAFDEHFRDTLMAESIHFRHKCKKVRHAEEASLVALFGEMKLTGPTTAASDDSTFPPSKYTSVLLSTRNKATQRQQLTVTPSVEISPPLEKLQLSEGVVRQRVVDDRVFQLVAITQIEESSVRQLVVAEQGSDPVAKLLCDDATSSDGHDVNNSDPLLCEYRRVRLEAFEEVGRNDIWNAFLTAVSSEMFLTLEAIGSDLASELGAQLMEHVDPDVIRRLAFNMTEVNEDGLTNVVKRIAWLEQQEERSRSFLATTALRDFPTTDVN